MIFYAIMNLLMRWNVDLKFVEVNKENLLLASLIQYKIFYLASCFDDYEYCALHDTGNRKYFLVYLKEKPIGVTGMSPDDKEKDMCWVTWFGLLPNQRGNGYGRIILEQTLEMIKAKGYKTARLYTSRKWNVNAQFLYKKVMDLEEVYEQEGDDYSHYVVFSKSLSGKPAVPIGNRNLHIQQSEKEDNLSIKHLKAYIKKHISKLDNEKDGALFKNLRTRIMPNDFPLYEIKSQKLMFSLFKQRKYDVYVLREGNQIWAYAILYNCQNGFSMLDYFAVKKDLRDIGLGSLFLEQIIKNYKNIVIELDPFDLDDDKSANTRRFKFYEKFSFRLTDIKAVLHKKYTYSIAALTENNKQANLKDKITELCQVAFKPNQFEIK